MDKKVKIVGFGAVKMSQQEQEMHDEIMKNLPPHVLEGKTVSFSIGTYNPLEEYMPVSIIENRALRRQREKEERKAQRRK